MIFFSKNRGSEEVGPASKTRFQTLRFYPGLVAPRYEKGGKDDITGYKDLCVTKVLYKRMETMLDMRQHNIGTV